MAEEPNKPKTPAERRAEYRRQEQERFERIEKTIANDIQRLKADPEVQKYLAQFSRYSAESFIDEYGHVLNMAVEYGKVFIDRNERQLTKYLQQATQCLKEIQLKKLVDLWCQWSANLVKVDTIEMTYDFFRETENIINSTVIPHITQEEFELYYAYASSPFFKLSDEHATSWNRIMAYRQKYASNTEEEENMEDAIPDWFSYHNLHTGNNQYLLLPDLRREKEEYYCNLYHEEKNRLQAEGEKPAPVQEYKFDTRPHISSYSYDDILAFMQRFEKPETIRIFEGYCKYSGNMFSVADRGQRDYLWLDEQVENILSDIRSLGGVVLPVTSHNDWRVALMESWEKYEKNQLLQALRPAYDDYQFMLANGIAYPSTESKVYNVYKELRGQILRGRELAGEPRNFDF